MGNPSVSISFRKMTIASVCTRFLNHRFTPLIHLRPEPLRDIRFVLDAHLGKLAVYLRMLGFDTLYRSDYSDEELADCSSQDKRVLLTKDRGLLKRSQVTHAHFVRPIFPKQQLIEVLQRFNLLAQAVPFNRCLACNHILQEAEKNTLLSRLQQDTIHRLALDQVIGCNDERTVLRGGMADGIAPEARSRKSWRDGEACELAEGRDQVHTRVHEGVAGADPCCSLLADDERDPGRLIVEHGLLVPAMGAVTLAVVAQEDDDRVRLLPRFA